MGGLVRVYAVAAFRFMCFVCFPQMVRYPDVNTQWMHLNFDI